MGTIVSHHVGKLASLGYEVTLSRSQQPAFAPSLPLAARSTMMTSWNRSQNCRNAARSSAG
jgi:hypothetical protein